jgi:hypothetical protein
MSSVFNDPEHWLWQEREARAIAESTSHAKAREILLRLASEYHKRAHAAERRRIPEPDYQSNRLT